jgi:hypothetical protein
MLTKEEIARFGAALMRAANSYVAPIYWGNPREEGNIQGNGTVFFVNTGENTFGVTNDHVVDIIIQRVAADHGLVSQIGDLPIDIERRLIARDSGLDLATLRISEDEVARLGKVVLTGSQSHWPPHPPLEGRGVFFVGFPGKERLAIRPRHISFGIYSGNTVATEVTDRVVTAHFNRQEWIDHLGHGLPPPGYDLGGLSGAPLLTLVEQDRVLSWRLGGIVYQVHADEELLVARRADFIRTDGTLLS